MKYLLLSIGLFFQIMVFAQDSEGSVKVTPALEKKFIQDIEKEVPVLSSELKKSDYNNLEIEFAIDTFRIEAYIDKYIEADHSNAGMVAATNEATHKYDSLLDKYYNKLLLILTPEDKKVLTEAQNAWLAFRDGELKLIQTLGNDKYSGGGTIQELIDRVSYMDLIKDRTMTIFDHLSMTTGEY